MANLFSRLLSVSGTRRWPIGGYWPIPASYVRIRVAALMEGGFRNDRRRFSVTRGCLELPVLAVSRSIVMSRLRNTDGRRSKGVSPSQKLMAADIPSFQEAFLRLSLLLVVCDFGGISMRLFGMIPKSRSCLEIFGADGACVASRRPSGVQTEEFLIPGVQIERLHPWRSGPARAGIIPEVLGWLEDMSASLGYRYTIMANELKQ